MNKQVCLLFALIVAFNSTASFGIKSPKPDYGKLSRVAVRATLALEGLLLIAFDGVLLRNTIHILTGKGPWNSIKHPHDDKLSLLAGCAVIGLLVGNVISQVLYWRNPDVICKWASTVKSKVEAEVLLVQLRNDSIPELRNFMREHNYSFRESVYKLFTLFKKIESAHSYTSWALETYTDMDPELQKNCETLTNDLGQLLSELKDFAEFFIYTKQWACELGFQEDKERANTLVPVQPYLIKSLQWSADLIGGNFEEFYPLGYRLRLPFYYTGRLLDLGD